MPKSVLQVLNAASSPAVVNAFDNGGRAFACEREQHAGTNDRARTFHALPAARLSRVHRDKPPACFLTAHMAEDGRFARRHLALYLWREPRLQPAFRGNGFINVVGLHLDPDAVGALAHLVVVTLFA